MALIECYECSKQISDTAPACPSCGAPAKRNSSAGNPAQKPPSINIFKKIIVIGFWGIVGLGVVGVINSKGTQPAREKTLAEQGIFLDSSATYAEVDTQVGCNSSYSDDKKADVFNASYRDRWMVWKGEITLLEAGEMSLNVDGKGTQDLSVEFEDQSEGYELKKGSITSVKFLMKRAGGCFLPFSGERAKIVSWR